MRGARATCPSAVNVFRYRAPRTVVTIVIQLNLVFTIIFIIEMWIKNLVMGPCGYVSDWYNVFDCLLVLLSIVEVVRGCEI